MKRRSILDLKRPADVLEIQYHIYHREIHAVAKLRNAQEPLFAKYNTCHRTFAEDHFNALLFKRRLSTDKDTPVILYFYDDAIYNEMCKVKPSYVTRLPNTA